MNLRPCYLLLLNIFVYTYCFAQISVTISSSPPLTIDFGNGTTNPGPPVGQFYSDFSYTKNQCPPPASYTISNTDACFRFIKRDAGHIFINARAAQEDSGYMMIATYQASAVSKTVFLDTIKKLCTNSTYLFWAGIRNLSNSRCFYPNFSFNVETLSGTLIQSFKQVILAELQIKQHLFLATRHPILKLLFLTIMAAFLHCLQA